MSMTQSKPALPAPGIPNLRETRRQIAEAKKRHPAGKQAPAAKALATAPAKAPATKVAKTPEKPARKAPAQSDKPKLRWRGDVAVVVTDGKDVEVGRRIPQADGSYHAAVKVGNKVEILAVSLSNDRAYAAVVGFYHRGERPVQKAVAATGKGA
jgi:sRNA-binding protein